MANYIAINNVTGRCFYGAYEKTLVFQIQTYPYFRLSGKICNGFVTIIFVRTWSLYHFHINPTLKILVIIKRLIIYSIIPINITGIIFILLNIEQVNIKYIGIHDKMTLIESRKIFEFQGLTEVNLTVQ